MAESETPETEVQPQEGVKKPSTTPKAIRLATISKLLEACGSNGESRTHGSTTTHSN